ncbi:hypothetical protein XCR_4496 [Xanthomonas campestris pv. raphani 756C]|nr:hypothetical protein XCR_4496 [Xanthomonas campestris pv. raphani 756C]
MTGDPADRVARRPCTVIAGAALGDDVGASARPYRASR